MSAMTGTLRATFRLRGTVLFWLFYVLMAGIAVLLLTVGGEGASGAFVPFMLALPAWMGWILFLPRLWQLQQHAESLGLSGGRRQVESATLLLGIVGTLLPSLLLILLGAPVSWTLLAHCLAFSAGIAFLVLTPVMGVLLLVAIIAVPPWLRKAWGPDLGEGAGFMALLWFLVAAMLAMGLQRWRRTMQMTGAAGRASPQVQSIAERGRTGGRVEPQDPSLNWVDEKGARVPRSAGPGSRLLSMSVLLCGPLAPLGWRNYLTGSGWMLLAVGFLASIALGGENTHRGPDAALLAIIGIWSLAIPLTLITRLRGLWRDEGHGLAEAALLPGLAAARRPWWQLVAMLVFTTAYRLAFPAILVALMLMYRSGGFETALLSLGVAAWALLMTCSLLPLARRRAAIAGFLLYVGVTALLVGGAVALVVGSDSGFAVLHTVLLPFSLPVAVLAFLGWLLPSPARPLVQP
ncbi:hypothetical protein [Pseudomarimonas salicorniae]|uniref:ABC-2 family transporter protein n=1 Tax=Pseudomarimonas salicorniae TaxID=2933270 RepID=A0ABT0GKH5_9GAMM|nr:hypothetical protein [Lysobacter sp. CAU 1642]MCK7594913.1 hypothetical protein [Lysobacter sp. CAU 1642]